MARGYILFMLSNDILVSQEAFDECIRLVKKYPQYLITPVHPPKYKEYTKYPLIDGYTGTTRGGENCQCVLKNVFEAIGPCDEVDVFTDGINWTNRRIAAGVEVMLTKEPMAFDMAPGKHSFKKQQAAMGYRGYKKETPIYSQQDLMNYSFKK